LIEIDGSFGEGGGSIVRISTALSALTSKPFHIFDIRANRPKKGLAAQHMNSAKAVAQISNAKIKGLQMGSSELEFFPGNLKEGNFQLDVKTAGSIGLILQSFMIIAPFASKPSKIHISGGTDIRWAPSIDYIKNVTLPVLEKMGYKANICLIKRGHYPKGGGEVKAEIFPLKKLNPINISKSEIDSIKGISHASNLPLHVAQRQASSAEKILKKTGYDVDIEIEHSSNNAGPGSGIVLWAQGNTRLGGSSIGKPGKPAEIVGEEAAKNLITNLKTNSALDEHMGDQIIPYMAIAGNSTLKVSSLTMHTMTNLNLVEKFLSTEFEVVYNGNLVDFHNLEKNLKLVGPVIIKSLN
jgi:RNA 3'-terminal phosphate cyclase (ATP)